MKSLSNAAAGMSVAVGMHARSGLLIATRKPVHIRYMAQLRRGGKILWREQFDNLVTRAGAAAMLDSWLGNGAPPATWYLGLVGSTSYTTGPATTDTAASHGGWVEETQYTGQRKAIAWSGATTGSNNIDKVASAALSFTLSANMSLRGAFVQSAATGTTGTLFSVGLFAAERTGLLSGDVISITPTARQTVS